MSTLTPSSLDQFLARFNRLERQYRRLRIVTVCLLILPGVIFLAAAAKKKPEPIETDKLVLRDSAGKTRAQLEMTKEGPMLRFLDDRGSDVASLGITNEALVLRNFDKGGGFQSGLALQRDGVALLCFDKGGRPITGQNAILLSGGVFVSRR
jgi:hypothetical protein